MAAIYVDAMDDTQAPPVSPRIDICTAADVGDWAMLRTELWPDGEHADHERFASSALTEPHRLVAFLARNDHGEPVGFAEASLRSDYVNGSSTSPVGFLEGVYVRRAARRIGIARELIAAVEQWARAQGCAELASDALLENIDSHVMHRRIGFAETDRVVYFIKALDGAGLSE